MMGTVQKSATPPNLNVNNLAKKAVNNSHRNLSLCMWNVGGMVCSGTDYHKINDPFFVETIKGYDIIALVETQMSPEQPLKLDCQKGLAKIK